MPSEPQSNLIPFGFRELRPFEPIDGLWRRQWRSLENGVTEEVSLVVWAQSGDRFADIRVPAETSLSLDGLDALQAFTGKLSLDGSSAFFDHDIDTFEGRPAGFDASYLLISDDRTHLREVGDDFIEGWVQTEEADSSNLVIERRDPEGSGERVLGRLLLIGHTAVGAWSEPTTGGGLWVRRAGWVLEELVGVFGSAPELDTICFELSNGAEVYDGWQVVKSDTQPQTMS